MVARGGDLLVAIQRATIKALPTHPFRPRPYGWSGLLRFPHAWVMYGWSGLLRFPCAWVMYLLDASCGYSGRGL